MSESITPFLAATRLRRPSVAALLLVALCTGIAAPAFANSDSLLALSEIQREEVPAPESPETPVVETPGPLDTVPLPDPIQRFPLPVPPPATSGAPTDDPANGEATGEGTDTIEAAPDILYDLTLLPEPVQRMRRLILEACKAGDIEALRPLLGPEAGSTQISFGGVEGDPIDFLRNLSGDDEGHEILAILSEVLKAGFVHLDVGEPGEIYVWPYFFAVSLETLTPPQRVELFTIVTAGDYEEMKTYGTYNFYRVGITPEGEWLFFVAGD